MALLVFPPSPFNGQLYPVSPSAGQYQYKWRAVDNTWRLLGEVTGVVPGTYCTSPTAASRFTVDATGRITFAECVEFGSVFVKLNNTSAYNNYVWPNTDGAAGEVLATNGVGDLTWIPMSGGGGGGSVTFVGAGTGLSVLGGGAAITTTGTLNLEPATTATLGGVVPDGTTITVSPTVVISAPSAGFGLTLQSSSYKLSIPPSLNPPVVSPAPSDATEGSLYYDTDLGALFYYYNDGFSSQWVQV